MNAIEELSKEIVKSRSLPGGHMRKLSPISRYEYLMVTVHEVAIRLAREQHADVKDNLLDLLTLVTDWQHILLYPDSPRPVIDAKDIEERIVIAKHARYRGKTIERSNHDYLKALFDALPRSDDLADHAAVVQHLRGLLGVVSSWYLDYYDANN